MKPATNQWLAKATHDAERQFALLSRSDICTKISDQHDILVTETQTGEVITVGQGHNRMSLLDPTEQFLEDITRFNGPPFRLKETRDGKFGLECGPLAKHFNRLNPGDLVIDDELEYSTEVEEYIETLRKMGVLSERFSRPEDLDSAKERRGYEYFNELVETLRARLNEPTVKRRIGRRKEDCKSNYRSVVTYMLKHLEMCRKLLVLRLDVGYRNGVDRPDLRSVKTVQEARADMRRFFANGRHNALFMHIVGHIGKLEYGRTKGYHFHIVIVMDGRKVRMDSYWARKFGFYWVDCITKGEGLFFNCNRGKRKRYGDKVGIGMVNYRDTAMQGRMFNALAYLTKEEQNVRVRLKGQKNFFRGTMPRSVRAEPCEQAQKE